MIETTVAPGTTEQVAYPQFKKIFRKRGVRKSHRTLNRMAATGKLPYRQKLPGRTGSYLFAREDVEEFAEAAS